MKMKQIKLVMLLGLLLWVEAASAFYNPTVGKWLNRDPIQEKGGLNLYGFVKNSPANYWDADGRLIGIIIVGGVVIAVEGVYLYCTRESNCLRYVQANLQYAANLVDNMPEYGNEPGSTTIAGQGTPQDALKHCIAACEVTKHPPGYADLQTEHT